MELLDITARNIERIGALFPNCVTEIVCADGICRLDTTEKLYIESDNLEV